ncbi:MAG: hypothetical protein H7A36_00935 [Chlamydiales bacterium]|nr:hypothetical protein [Chlamydiales bacterium]
MILLLLLFCSSLFAQQTSVESDDAHYNGSVITLTGKVHVENEMGELFADVAILTKDEAKTTRIDFPWIELKQNVRFDLEQGRHLLCDHAFLDYTKKTSLIVGSQAHYSDDHGEVFANRAVIDYEEDGKQLRPTKVTLYDDVRMVNREKEQYALADTVEYFPAEERMILKGECVLFYDKERSVELSAKEVHAKRDEEKRESVRGIGNVRFLFGASEMDKLEQRFGKCWK